MNILITGAWGDAKNNIEKLKSMGHEIAFLQWEKDPLPCGPEWVEGIIGNGIFLSHAIEQFTKLRYIQLTSAGFDRVPMDYVKERDIAIYNARGVYSIPMAEFAMAGVLQHYKHAAEFSESQKKHEWNKIRNIREINGSTVCVVGCGSVGTECAKRFKAFGATVLGIDLFPYESQWYDEMYSLEYIDTILDKTDIMIVTVPYSEDTKNLFNKERMMSLKKDAVLVNIARGGVMDFQSFIELKSGERRDLRAVFDVFETEPLAEDSPLWDMEGVIVTPHNSFVGDKNQQRLNQLIFSNLEKLDC